MPNWCMNELTISGKKEELEKFIEDAKMIEDDHEIALSFDKMLPCPDNIKDPNPMILSDAAYNWYVENWGTKWDAQDAVLDLMNLDNEEIYYTFDTAWSPPCEWLVAIAPRYPKLRFDLEYGEPGMEFQGEFSVSGDEVIQDCEGKFDKAKWGWDNEEDEEEAEESGPVA